MHRQQKTLNASPGFQHYTAQGFFVCFELTNVVIELLKRPDLIAIFDLLWFIYTIGFVYDLQRQGILIINSVYGCLHHCSIRCTSWLVLEVPTWIILWVYWNHDILGENLFQEHFWVWVRISRERHFFCSLQPSRQQHISKHSGHKWELARLPSYQIVDSHSLHKDWCRQRCIPLVSLCIIC